MAVQSDSEKVANGVQRSDLRRDVMTSQGLDHGGLAFSETLQKILATHPVSNYLKPLFDKIMATGYLDANGVVRTKHKYSIAIKKKLAFSYEDAQSEHDVLDLVRTYFPSFIDSQLNGYRGKLVTEDRKAYVAVTESKKKNWGIGAK